jgi:hypothetical protein
MELFIAALQYPRPDETVALHLQAPYDSVHHEHLLTQPADKQQRSNAKSPSSQTQSS